MDRRNFIKVSGAAAAGLALTGCGPRTGENPVPVLPPVDPSRIVRDVDRLEPLQVKEIHVKAGASKPFGVLHVSDTHITRADNRDDERKIKLAASRSRGMTYGEHYLDEAILCGHCHRFYEERFSSSAMLYAVDATYHGGVQAVYFE